MRVNEIFRSIQGEGIEAGRVTCFVRFTGCDFRCRFCDSKHTWVASDKDLIYTPQQLFDEIQKMNVNHVTLTGGNPAIYEDDMEILLNLLKDNGYKIAIETQGSIYRSWFRLIDSITISPKFINHYLTEETYIDNINSIIDIANDYGVMPIIKSPIFSENDIKKYKEFTSRLDGKFLRYLSVGNSWTDLELKDGDLLIQLLLDRYRNLINLVLMDKELKDVSILPQIHTLVWANMQGV